MSDADYQRRIERCEALVQRIARGDSTAVREVQWRDPFVRGYICGALRRFAQMSEQKQ